MTFSLFPFSKIYRGVAHVIVAYGKNIFFGKTLLTARPVNIFGKQLAPPCANLLDAMMQSKFLI